jgi:hypothetical protein
MRELGEGLALLPPAQPPCGPAPDWPAVARALEALRQALGEDDARAGRDLADLAALLRGGPLWADLAPLKARVESYDYRGALELIPGFMDRVRSLRGPD